MVNTLVLERVTRRDLDTLYICQAANNNVSVPRSASVKIDILGETELNYWYNIETLLEVSEDHGHPTPIIEKYIDCKTIVLICKISVIMVRDCLSIKSL